MPPPKYKDERGIRSEGIGRRAKVRRISSQIKETYQSFVWMAGLLPRAMTGKSQYLHFLRQKGRCK